MDIIWVSAVLLSLVSMSAIADDKFATTQPVTFNDDVKLVFRQRCVACHNSNKTSGGLELSNYSAMMQGSSSGDAIEPGSAEDSYLMQLVTHESSPEMPPDSEQIPGEEIDIIRKWINMGAVEKAGQQPRTTKKKPSLEMSEPVTGRPEQVAMPLSWNTETRTATVRAPMARSMTCSPWAPILAIAAANQVIVYQTGDAGQAKVVGVFHWPNGQPETVRFSRDGSHLLVGGGVPGSAGKVILLDVASGKTKLELGDELDCVLGADISASFSQVAIGGPERTVRVWSTESESVLFEKREHTDWVTAIEFSPDGKQLATADRDGGVFIWESATGDELFRLDGHKADVTALSWRLDSKVLATASESGKVTLWDAERGISIKSFDANKGGCLALTFAADGRLLTGGRDKQVFLWNGKGKQLRKFSGLSDIVVSVAFNDEANQVFAGDFSGQVFGWNAASGKRVSELNTNPGSINTSISGTHAAKEADTE